VVALEISSIAGRQVIDDIIIDTLEGIGLKKIEDFGPGDEGFISLGSVSLFKNFLLKFEALDQNTIKALAEESKDLFQKNHSHSPASPNPWEQALDHRLNMAHVTGGSLPNGSEAPVFNEPYIVFGDYAVYDNNDAGETDSLVVLQNRAMFGIAIRIKQASGFGFKG